MSALVKGMEMPKNCATCYRDGTHYHVHMLVGCPFLQESMHSHDFRKERHPNCPLIEVPEPHGRLIDADALKDKPVPINGIWDDERNAFRYYPPTYMQAIEEIINAPTIIEAEGRE